MEMQRRDGVEERQPRRNERLYDLRTINSIIGLANVIKHRLETLQQITPDRAPYIRGRQHLEGESREDSSTYKLKSVFSDAIHTAPSAISTMLKIPMTRTTQGA